MNQSLIPATNYQAYLNYMQKNADIKYALAVLQWDQETYMPLKGAAARARQLATLSEWGHEMFTSNELGNMLQMLMNQQLNESERRNVELSLYDFEQFKKIPSAFVRKLSETCSMSFNKWVEARKANDFKVFEKSLSVLVVLKKEEAQMLGYHKNPYDALLNQYERGCTVEMLDRVFEKLEGPLKKLLASILEKTPVSDALLKQYFPKKSQWDFGMELLAKMGFDFEAGRQDLSEHPFTTNFSSNDVRISTRIDEMDFSNMTWSCLHELGHALYEQGLPAQQYGLPLGEYASLSIHESQSRLWENNVGRSRQAWEYLLPFAKQYFPKQLEKADIGMFYKAINKVQPSLIRTEADELTYHFHVMIRYELEKKLIEGSLAVKDIPEYWNASYEKQLGIKVPDDINGCLQDVHWSHGSFGYFPTYSLGSLYAAQFYQTATKNIPHLENEIRNGAFSTLLNWLRQNIHQYGRQYQSEALCNVVTGSPLNIDYFIQYATHKYQEIYK